MLFSAFSMTKSDKINPIRARKKIVTKRKCSAIKTSKMTPISYNLVIRLQRSKRVTKKYYSNRFNTRKCSKNKFNLNNLAKCSRIRRNLACTREMEDKVWQ